MAMYLIGTTKKLIRATFSSKLKQLKWAFSEEVVDKFWNDELLDIDKAVKWKPPKAGPTALMLIALTMYTIVFSNLASFITFSYIGSFTTETERMVRTKELRFLNTAIL